MTEHPHPYEPFLRILKVPADHDLPMEFVQIDDNLQSMRDAIGGGYLQELRRVSPQTELPCGCHLVMVVDEDGKMKALDINPRATAYYEYDIIRGNVFFVGEGPKRDADGEVTTDFISLPGEFHTWEGPGHPLPTP